MTSARKALVTLFWLATFALIGGATVMVLKWTPVEASMGPIQKIFYLHLPAAICTFFACLTCFVASIGYLSQRKTWWDDFAWASAQVAVILCSIVLLTGMVWGRVAWGQWWTWSPRLTFSLVLWLLYVVYLMVRMSVESGQRRAMIGSVYGIIAFLDVPLVWLSTRLMVDIHPRDITLAPEMKLTLAVCFVPVVLAAIGLTIWRFNQNRRLRLEQSSSPAETAPTSFQWVGGES
jgi:heme exporter protein C